MSDRAGFIDCLPRHSAGAEIGVWRGEFSRELWERLQPSRLMLVDPWERNHDVTNMSSTVTRMQEAIDCVYQEVVENLAGLSGIEIIRGRSLDVAQSCGVNFDWVYVDACHDRASVADDLAAWWPHLEPGGLLCGHDLQLEDVRVAVDTFARSVRMPVVCVGNNYIITKPGKPAQKESADGCV